MWEKLEQMIYASVVPWKSPLMLMKSDTINLVEGQ
jgi:hypothetical protein